MTQVFLKKKEVPIDEQMVTITQLSGLDRLNYMDYCAEIPEPESPNKPPEGATQEEQERYLLELKKYSNAWFRLNFMAQARLVAYGYPGDSDNIDERHQQIMSIMSPPQVEALYREIALFSGLSIPGQEETAPSDNSEATPTAENATTEDTTTQEPTDPKV
ncbi:hypothetical protein [Vibrio alginolyticus]|uniref:hypothetical protein n=1 Tax=Vibrio alginolyticus TaxID=663 RepID=UPI0021D068B4